MGRGGMSTAERRSRTLMSAVAACCATVSLAGEPIAFSDIHGARRADGKTWNLALGAPSDAGVVTRKCDIVLKPNVPVPLAEIPPYLRGKEFAVLLNLADVAGGVLRLSSPPAPDDVRCAMVSRDGWTAMRFGPVAWAGQLPLTACATSAMRVTRVTVYRRFDQIFGRAGRVDLVGAAYHKLGDSELLSYPLLPASYREPRTGQWRRPPAGSEDGIDGARLAKSYQGFLNGPLQDEQGLRVPVRAPGGVVLCGRMKGRFAIIVYPEVAKYILTWQGTEGQWTVPATSLDGATLDGNGNGVYTGLKKVTWATAKTWADNFGTGFLDFVALLPQNEIPIDRRQAGQLVLEYASTQGLRALTVNVHRDTEAVALLHSGPHRTDVLLRSQDRYTSATTVRDSVHADCLAATAGSIRFERRAPGQE